MSQRLSAEHLIDEPLQAEVTRVRRREAHRDEALAAQALLVALRARDGYTGSHSDTVVRLSRAVARELQLPPDLVRDVEHVAMLHDVGKLGVPDAILHKPAALDHAEWEVMRTHPSLGAELLRSIPALARLADAVEGEHERWDGAGYPAGLVGTDIPVASRIILACDAMDAMTTDRPYRPAMTDARAQEELRRHRGTQFEPAVVDALLRVLRHRRHVPSLRISLAERPAELPSG